MNSAERSRIDVREVAWQVQRHDLERFRSRVRSEAGGRGGSGGGSLDSVPERTLDALRSTRHLCAFDRRAGGELIAHIRLHPLPAEDLSRFELDRLDRGVSVWMLSGFAVAPAHRDGPAPVRLLEATYERARGLGADVLAVDMPPDKVLMFEALGFFRCSTGRRAGAGFLVPLLLNLQDVAYMRRVGSPLAAIAQRYLNPDPHGAALLSSIGGIVEETRPPRRALVAPAAASLFGANDRSGDADGAREDLADRDEDPEGVGDPDEPPAAGLLRQLDEFMVGGILARGLRQTVPRGTNLHEAVDGQGRFYLLVRGTVGLIPAGAYAPIAYLSPGDVVAHTALAEGAVTGSIRAQTLSECSVLMLSEDDLDRIAHADPLLAAQLMFRLLRGMAGRVARTTQLLIHDRAPGPSTIAARGRLRIRPEDVLPNAARAWRKLRV